MNVPAAKAALLVALAADLPSGTHVQPGQPAEEPRKLHRVYVTGTEDFRRTDDLGGTRYLIRVLVEVAGTGNDPERTSDEAWELITQITAIIDADDDLDGTVHYAQVFDVREEVYAADNGWLAQAIVRVQVENREAGLV